MSWHWVEHSHSQGYAPRSLPVDGTSTFHRSSVPARTWASISWLPNGIMPGTLPTTQNGLHKREPRLVFLNHFGDLSVAMPPGVEERDGRVTVLEFFCYLCVQCLVQRPSLIDGSFSPWCSLPVITIKCLLDIVHIRGWHVGQSFAQCQCIKNGFFCCLSKYWYNLSRSIREKRARDKARVRLRGDYKHRPRVLQFISFYNKYLSTCCIVDKGIERRVRVRRMGDQSGFSPLVLQKLTAIHARLSLFMQEADCSYLLPAREPVRNLNKGVHVDHPIVCMRSERVVSN